MYNLSDPALERQANDRISFMNFLGFPEKIPDQTTVWYFRERLAKTGKDKAIWSELQRQLDAKGLKIRKGTIQDATFINADPGHATVNTPRGDDAKTRRSKDGTWTKKGNKSFFGYKLHTKEDCDFGLIRALEVTPRQHTILKLTCRKKVKWCTVTVDTLVFRQRVSMLLCNAVFVVTRSGSVIYSETLGSPGSALRENVLTP